MNAEKQIGGNPNECVSVIEYLHLADRLHDMRALFIQQQLVSAPADLKDLFLNRTEPCIQGRDLRMLIPRDTSAYELLCAKKALQSRVVSWNEPQSVKLLADCDPTKIDMPDVLLVHDDYSSRYAALDRFQFATYERIVGRNFFLRTYSLIHYHGRGDGLLDDVFRLPVTLGNDSIVYAGFNPKLGPLAYQMMCQVDRVAHNHSAYRPSSLVDVIAQMIMTAGAALARYSNRSLSDIPLNLGPLFTLRAVIDGTPVNATLSRGHLCAQQDAIYDPRTKVCTISQPGMERLLQSLRSGGEIKSDWCLVLRDGLTGYYPFWGNCAFNNPAIFQDHDEHGFTPLTVSFNYSL